jgi:cysteine desulfurase
LIVESPCYLDHNATAPLRPQAAQAVVLALAQCGNPSSVHSYGRAARRIVEHARRQVATLVSARPDAIVFTSGGTEANNLALRGCGFGRVLASAVEHPSVLEVLDGIETVPVDEDGIVDLDSLARMLERDGEQTVVSVMLANNETGVILPVAEAARIAHQRGALIHCDAVQAAGRLRLDMDALGVDMLTLSAHKMGGPKGMGALVVSDRMHLNPIIRGGGQERGRRSGTENVPGIAGFGAAADAAVDEIDAAQAASSLRDRLEDRILRDVPRAQVVGAGVRRLPNTSCIALPGMSADTQIMALDLAGFAVSAGSACSSGKVKASHVLHAMGRADEIAGCAIRISLGPANNESEIDRFFAAYGELASRAQTSAA